MELAFLVYTISLLNSISTILVILGIVVLLLSFFFCMTYYGSCYCDTSAWKWAKIWFFTAISFFCVSALIPSQKTAYMMVGAYAAQKVAENPKTVELSGKVIKIIEANLDKYVDEAFEESKKAATSKSKD